MFRQLSLGLRKTLCRIHFQSQNNIKINFPIVPPNMYIRNAVTIIDPELDEEEVMEENEDDGDNKILAAEKFLHEVYYENDIKDLYDLEEHNKERLDEINEFFSKNIIIYYFNRVEVNNLTLNTYFFSGT